ncbi:hypothetical protein ND748_01055 [Frankia sp. AiPs1]|uniref:type II secretion system F family protein n=1 Tax=Frankia sp. AiPs1 TaxID=573493 RepID=UPI002043A9EC|nr:hypothetical protein [Frankia sp. AiPs1]MCM3920277.1 hypothetical protein [Frankia sp. AiPs1]
MSGLALAAVALGGAVAGLGAWLFVAAAHGAAIPTRLAGRHPALPARRIVLLLAVAVLAGAVTRAPALSLVIAAVGYVTFDAGRGPSVPAVTRLGEAVATWTEAVRDGLGAGRHLRAALVASCDRPPDELAEALGRLAVRLDTMSVPDALRALRAEVSHPALGPVATALDVAYQRGAGDLTRLMASQVETTRADVARLRDQHALRAKHRRSMTLLLVLFAASITVVLAVSPAFFAPYRTLTGQLVLAALGAAVVGAVHSLARMSQPDLPPDFFTPEVP